MPDTPPAMNRQGTAAKACEVPSARAGLLTGTSAPDFAFPNRADSSRREGQSAGGGAALSGQFSGVTDVQTGWCADSAEAGSMPTVAGAVPFWAGRRVVHRCNRPLRYRTACSMAAAGHG